MKLRPVVIFHARQEACQQDCPSKLSPDDQEYSITLLTYMKGGWDKCVLTLKENKKNNCLSVFAISERSVLLQIFRNRCAQWEGAAWRLCWADGFITPPKEKQWLSCGLREGRLESDRRSRHLGHEICRWGNDRMGQVRDACDPLRMARVLPASSLCPDLLLHGSWCSKVSWPAIVITHYTNPWWNNRWE